MANLDVVYGDRLPDKEKRAVARAAFQNFALLAVDLFWFSRKTEQRISRWVRFDESCQTYFQTRSALLLGPHIGNWEVMGQAIALRSHAWHSVAMPLKNLWIDARIRAMRQSTGQFIVPRAGAVRRLLSLLRSGERVALLMDQNTKPSDGGVFVDFFGLPAPVSRAAAALAIRAQVPVITMMCLPEPDGGYRAYASEPLVPPSGKANETPFTQTLCHQMEKIIMKAPGHWLWMYKRWKYIPEGGGPNRYPFYAKRSWLRANAQTLTPSP